MKKLLIIIGAICYCVAPDLFFGPVDDAIIALGSVAYTLATTGGHKDPEYVTMERDF